MTRTEAPLNLAFDLPAQPQSLARLSLLLNRSDLNFSDLSGMIEADLSLAAAVMNAVSSPLYGLKGRAQSVQQALTYLGIREVSAIVFENGLRSAFPPVPELHAVWERARLRGLLMGRLAQALSMEAWGPHTAGLFEECGKAVLFKHAPGTYLPLLKAAADDADLVEREQAAFGIGHDELGAQLCERWGLTAAAVNSVRHHVTINTTHRLPRVPHRYICVLSALADTMMREPSKVDEVAAKLAPQAMLDQGSLLRGLQRIQDKIEGALAEA